LTWYPPQIHRRKQHIQKPTKRTPKKPKNAPGNGIPRTHDVLGYDQPLFIHSIKPIEITMLLITLTGYKFEVLSVLRKPWDSCTRAEIEGRQDEVVNNSAQYCSVVKTGMGNVRMVLGGEVDAGACFNITPTPFLLDLYSPLLVIGMIY
jgi:hypothetical protein